MAHRVFPSAAAAIALVWIATSGISVLAASLSSPAAAPSPPAAEPDSVASREAEHVAFHDYEFDVPATEGWQLVQRAPEDQSIEIRLVAGQGAKAFTQGDISVSRIGLYEPGIARNPRLAFQALGAAEVAVGKAQALQRPDLHWLGAQFDSVTDADRTFYRLSYGLESRAARGDAWIVFWFPPSFSKDGFYIRAALQAWKTPDRVDPLLPDEFVNLVRSLSARRPEQDPRIVPEGPDSSGKARLSLPYFYYDARAAVLNSPHDTTRTACWTQIEDSVAVGLQPTRLPGVTFASFRNRVPSATDHSPGERFGKAFDRNGDGQFDLVFLSQGWADGQDGRSIRTFYVLADDDFDGRLDGVVYEDGDQDQDGRVDHALFVQDRARKGVPDRAWVFSTDIASPVRPVPHRGTMFLFARASRPNARSFDLSLEFADWTRYLGWLNRGARACRGSQSRK